VREFPVGALQREIERRGMSQESFAKEAQIAPTTVLRACKGLKLNSASWRKIVTTLSVIPVLVAPEGLEVVL
jgi:predicted transcriptional regulator